MKADPIFRCLDSVTKKWTKQEKAKERSAGPRINYWVGRDYDFQNEVAWEIMEEVYNKVSDNGRLPALARQMMYAARPIIQQRTGKPLNDKYFTQTVLPDFMNARKVLTADWKVVYDARGSLREPHTKLVLPLGTLAVRGHLNARANHKVELPTYSTGERLLYPTVGPKNRYGDILFVEKEGFLPLFDAVQLRERYDIAIMSTKGMSVTAARELIDQICATASGGGVRLLVLRDFDKAGFSIVGTLKRSTRRFTYKNAIEVIDLGLRMDDIDGLESEEVFVDKDSERKRRKCRSNLIKNGATAEEAEFLFPEDIEDEPQRVELNAFTSDALVTWVEGKLDERGVKKLVPDAGTLIDAYRRTKEQLAIQQKINEAVAEFRKIQASAIEVPPDLKEQVEVILEEDPTQPWDEAVARVAGWNDPDEESGE